VAAVMNVSTVDVSAVWIVGVGRAGADEEQGRDRNECQSDAEQFRFHVFLLVVWVVKLKRPRNLQMLLQVHNAVTKRFGRLLKRCSAWGNDSIAASGFVGLSFWLFPFVQEK